MWRAGRKPDGKTRWRSIASGRVGWIAMRSAGREVAIQLLVSASDFSEKRIPLSGPML
jgi:hypothetical protein